MIDNVLAKDINGLEPRLTRQGYNAKVLADTTLHLMTPQVLTVSAGISGIIGLLALISYFYYSYRIRKIETSERSIRLVVEGEGLFNADQILQILREFKDDTARLEALKTFATNQKAERVYSKIKNNVDLVHLDTQNAKRLRQLSLQTAVVSLVIAFIGLTYSAIGSSPTPAAKPLSAITKDPRVIALLYATNRVLKTAAGAETPQFSTDWSPNLTFGSAAVRVPEEHTKGRVERPETDWFFYLLVACGLPDPERPRDHFTRSGSAGVNQRRVSAVDS